MTLPAARTRDEAHLYMDTHPCERCGDVNVGWKDLLTNDSGVPARRYRGTCGNCGAPREFVFALPPHPPSPPAGEMVFFGGPEPSGLLDPGEWLLVADLCAQAAETGAGPHAGPEAEAREARAGERPDAEVRESMATAVAAMDEVLKFIPANANAVPESAFWSARGRNMYRQEPGRFQRRRLLIVRDSYRLTLDQMAAR